MKKYAFILIVSMMVSFQSFSQEKIFVDSVAYFYRYDGFRIVDSLFLDTITMFGFVGVYFEKLLIEIDQPTLPESYTIRSMLSFYRMYGRRGSMIVNEKSSGEFDLEMTNYVDSVVSSLWDKWLLNVWFTENFVKDYMRIEQRNSGPEKLSETYWGRRLWIQIPFRLEFVPIRTHSRDSIDVWLEKLFYPWGRDRYLRSALSSSP